MTVPALPAEKPKPAVAMRLVPRFSIRSLLLLTCALAVLMAVVGREVYRARRQRETVDLLGEAGAAVYYSYVIANTPPAGPAWAADWFAFDYYNSLEGVQKHDSPGFTDADLARLSELTDLKFLELMSGDLDDRRLAWIAPLVRLESLQLRHSDITDEGLVHLSAMQELSYLNLDDTLVRGPGLKHVPGVKSLGLRDCMDVDLAALAANLTKIESLALDGCTFDETQLVHLAKIPTLRELGLSRTRIGDAGLAYVAQIPQLTRLELNGTQVTDQGMSALRSLERLEVLLAHGTTVTAESREILKGMPRLTRFTFSPNWNGAKWWTRKPRPSRETP